MGVLSGSGCGLVARDSRAAFQFLFEQALRHPELEELDDDDAEDQQQEEEGSEVHSDREGQQPGEAQEAKEDPITPRTRRHHVDHAQPAQPQMQLQLPILSSSMVARVWSPSARLLAHFPPVLQLPFVLLGTWDRSTGQVLLTKQDAQGAVVYSGVSFLIRPAAPASAAAAFAPVPVDRFQLSLLCEFATADLTFELQPSADEDDQLQPGAASPAGAANAS